MSLRILWTLIGTLVLIAPVHAQQHIPRDPRALIEELTPDQIMKGWHAYYQALREEVAHAPERFVPIIRDYMHVPDRLEDLDFGDPGVRAQVGRGNRVLTAVVPALGRKHAEPILIESFARARPLYREAWAADVKAQHEFRERGWPRTELLPEEMARSERLVQIIGTLSGRMTRAIVVASELRSPVIVDQVLEFYEAGLEDRQSFWPRYPLLFAAERPDVIPRLRALEANQETPDHVRHHIKLAFEWYAQTLAEAEPPQPVVAQAESTPPTPAGEAAPPVEPR